MKTLLIIFMMLFWVTSSMLSQSSTIVDNHTVATKVDELIQYSYDNGMFNGVDDNWRNIFWIKYF